MRVAFRPALLAAALCVLAGFPLTAQITAPALLGTHPKQYPCMKTLAPPAIDGRLDDVTWMDAPWTDSFLDIEGARKPKPRYKTRVKMLWDESHLYIAAELEEPHLWARLLKRDTVIFYDNDFEVFIDPNGDSHEYYEFEMNAYNTGWDLFLPIPYKDGGSARDAFDFDGIRTAVQLYGTINDPRDTDTGWTLEIAIPFRSFNAGREPLPAVAEGGVWRINFSRVEWRAEIDKNRYVKREGIREDNWVWAPQGVIDMHRPEMWGYLHFVKPRDHSAPQVLPKDPLHEAKSYLMSLYYMQRTYKDKRKQYAPDLRALGAPVAREGLFTSQPMIRRSGDGYIIEGGVRNGGETAVVVSVSHDAALRVRKP
ncbi:MAG: carbohydrate-binding family 9-like protein [Ignavibacteriae bacterium]|nr:carbohydrate-binding family 9-like protein [Ignavibacteriota bacterium]